MFKLVQEYLPISDLIYSLPDIQRPIDENRVNELLLFQEDFYSKNGTYLTNGTVSIVEITEPLKPTMRYLVDGQHRVAVFESLQKKYPERPLTIFVDKYLSTDVNAVEQIYKIVNSSKPVGIGNISISIYKCINDIEKFIKANFKEYLVNSANPRKPNINMDKLKECIIERKMIDVTKTYDYIHGIRELNKFYGEVPDNTYIKWHVDKISTTKQIIDSRPSKFYLGYYSNFEWIDRIADNRDGIPFQQMEHYSSTYRPKILKSMRNKVWAKNKQNTATIGQCYVCEEHIYPSDFECGHIVPVCRGGLTVIENLEAICKDCNSQMGRMNLLEYKASVVK